MRDRSLYVQVVASLCAVAAAAIVAWLLDGGVACVVVLALGLVLALTFIGVTVSRQRRIARLSALVDRALSGIRDISFADMREGELAVLSNEIDKTLSQLALANEELGAEKTRLADALANISHQLKTPLTSLGIELDLMRREAQTPEQRMRAVEGLRLVERVQWLVSSLLKLARIDAGVVHLAKQPVDVAELVSSAYQPLAVSFDLADVSFVQEVADGASFVGDLAWTREALTNVLKNCLEHTPGGGRVLVRATEDVLACRIVVEDTGTGISQEDLPHVFERFYHGSPAGEDQVNPAGVGIGLALARALVTEQGGRIVASNAHDASGSVTGARFELAFFKVNV